MGVAAAAATCTCDAGTEFTLGDVCKAGPIGVDCELLPPSSGQTIHAATTNTPTIRKCLPPTLSCHRAVFGLAICSVWGAAAADVAAASGGFPSGFAPAASAEKKSISVVIVSSSRRMVAGLVRDKPRS